MVNHVSRQSEEFRDFERHGRRSEYADLFITLDKVWPDGEPARGRRRSDLPAQARCPLLHDHGRRYRRARDGLDVLRDRGLVGADRPRPAVADDQAPHRRVARLLRLAGCADRPPRCGRLRRQETGHELLHGRARDLGGPRLARRCRRRPRPRRAARRSTMSTPRTRSSPPTATGRTTSCSLACCCTRSRPPTHRDWRPTSRARPSASSRRSTATTASRCALTSTASSPRPRCSTSRTSCRRAGRNVNRILSDSHADGVDVHQLNCTYYSALGCDDDRYVAARAIQLFARGIPQLYYVGLLAGENDDAAVERTGEGRAINRHDYTIAEIDDGTRPTRRQAHRRTRQAASDPPSVRWRPDRHQHGIRVDRSDLVARRRGL